MGLIEVRGSSQLNCSLSLAFAPLSYSVVIHLSPGYHRIRENTEWWPQMVAPNGPNDIEWPRDQKRPPFVTRFRIPFWSFTLQYCFTILFDNTDWQLQLRLTTPFDKFVGELCFTILIPIELNNLPFERWLQLRKDQLITKTEKLFYGDRLDWLWLDVTECIGSRYSELLQFQTPWG